MLYVIIPAAGSGSRMGGPINKIFMEVGGRSVLNRTLDAFRTFSSSHELKVIVVTQEANIKTISDMVDSEGYTFVSDVVAGGATRTESVYNGFKAIINPSPDDIIFIHDGARCLISQEVLENCISGIKDCEVCVAAVPLKSTVKIVDENGFVKYTPKRSELMEVQTPQVFMYRTLKTSYEFALANNVEATDDTSLAEAAGIPVKIVNGSYSNIKITTPEDIAIAEGILA